MLGELQALGRELQCFEGPGHLVRTMISKVTFANLNSGFTGLWVKR